MPIEWKFSGKQDVYLEIAKYYEKHIILGVLRAGDKLPSVRDLATQLTINPNTIQRAYRELEVQGWIASVPGKGSFVCGVPECAQEEHTHILEDFDKLTRQLIALGFTREALAERIRQGGNETC